MSSSPHTLADGSLCFCEGRTTFWRAEDEAILDRMWGRPHTDIETMSGRALFDKAKASSTQELTITAQALRMTIPAIEIEAESRLIQALRAALASPATRDSRPDLMDLVATLDEQMAGIQPDYMGIARLAIAALRRVGDSRQSEGLRKG